ncbi:hypothetical protein D3C84_1202270 [compost metagenome]
MALKTESGGSQFLKIESNFFGAFIENLVQFFETGAPVVPKEQTLVIAAILESGRKAAAMPFQWVELP